MGTGGNKRVDPKKIVAAAVERLEQGLRVAEFELSPSLRDYRKHPFFRATAQPGTYYLDLGDPADKGPRMVVTLSVYDPDRKPRKQSSAEEKLKAVLTLVQHGPRGSEWQEAGILHAIEQVLTDKAGTSASELKELMNLAKDF